MTEKPVEPSLDEIAIRNALQHLRFGRKHEARAWALRAVKLAPEKETPWLILAALAKPEASVEYLKEALRINPDSPHARQGLKDVQRKLESGYQPGVQFVRPEFSQASETKTTQIPIQATGRRMIASRTRPTTRLRWVSLTLTIVLAISPILTFAWILSKSMIVQAQGNHAASQVQFASNLQDQAGSVKDVNSQALPANATPPKPTISPFPTATQLRFPIASLTDTPESTSTPSETPPEPTLAPVSEVIVAEHPESPEPGMVGKSIIVSLSKQRLYAYTGASLDYQFVVSTGANNNTKVGKFSILDKLPRPWSDPWGFWMPYWMGIYWVGYTENGIHALPVLTNGEVIWGNSLGTPSSYGCVVLATDDAQWLYDWVEVGTVVEIRP